jgi:hypothetical protein
MKRRSSSSLKFTALLLICGLLPANAALVLASTSLMPEGTLIAPQGTLGRLVTRGNQPVTVNGNSVVSGATIPSGATISTSDGVGATINLGPLGSVELAPNTEVTIEYSDGRIKVTVIQGCLILRNKKGTYAEIDTAQGKVASNDPNTKPESVLDVCQPAGTTPPIVNQGAAANAGAGAGGGGATVGGGGLSPVGTVLILGGIAAGIGIPVALHGSSSNPSPSGP